MRPGVGTSGDVPWVISGKADLAREVCSDKGSWRAVGSLLSQPPNTASLAESRTETHHWLFSPCPAPPSRPLWEPQESGTGCPGNVMSARTALVSVLNYPLK